MSGFYKGIAVLAIDGLKVAGMSLCLMLLTYNADNIYLKLYQKTH